MARCDAVNQCSVGDKPGMNLLDSATCRLWIQCPGVQMQARIIVLWFWARYFPLTMPFKEYQGITRTIHVDAGGGGGGGQIIIW